MNYFVYTYMYMQFSSSFFIPLSLSLSLFFFIPLSLSPSFSLFLSLSSPSDFSPFSYNRFSCSYYVTIMVQFTFLCRACNDDSLCVLHVYMYVCVCVCVWRSIVSLYMMYTRNGVNTCIPSICTCTRESGWVYGAYNEWEPQAMHGMVVHVS